MAKFEKGHKKLGGRKPGVANVATRELREALTPLVTAYVNGEGVGEKLYTLEKDFEGMTPPDRARTISALVPYIIPKLTSVEVKDPVPVKSFKDELDELSD